MSLMWLPLFYLRPYLVTIGSAAWFGPHLPNVPLKHTPVLPTGFLKCQATGLIIDCLPVGLLCLLVAGDHFKETHCYFPVQKGLDQNININIKI